MDNWDSEITMTVLDPDGVYEDIECIIYDDVVYIRQYDFNLEQYDYMILSPKQMINFMKAFKMQEGAYSEHGEKLE